MMLTFVAAMVCIVGAGVVGLWLMVDKSLGYLGEIRVATLAAARRLDEIEAEIDADKLRQIVKDL
jgi:hypothetical protein